MQAVDKMHVDNAIAALIKQHFDKRHGPTWHCVVGRHFGNSWLFYFINVVTAAKSSLYHTA